jgi:hypothetical protein
LAVFWQLFAAAVSLFVLDWTQKDWRVVIPVDQMVSLVQMLVDV